MLAFDFTMLDPLGFHSRLADKMAKFIKRTEWSCAKGCQITIWEEHSFMKQLTPDTPLKRANARVPEEVLELKIRPGDKVIIEIDGGKELDAMARMMYFFAVYSQVRFESENPNQNETILNLYRLAEDPRNAFAIIDELYDERVLNGPGAAVGLKEAALKADMALGGPDESEKLQFLSGVGQGYKAVVFQKLERFNDEFQLPKTVRDMLLEEFNAADADVLCYLIVHRKGPWLVTVRESNSEKEWDELGRSVKFKVKYNARLRAEEERRQGRTSGSTAAQPPARSQPAAAERPKQQEEEGSLAGGFVLLGFALTLAAVGSFVVFTWFPGAQTIATIVLGLLITAGFAGLFAELDHVVPGIVVGLVVQAFLLHYIWSMGGRVILPTLLVGIALVVVPALLTGGEQ